MSRHITAWAAGLLALSAHATSPLPLSGPLLPLSSQHSANTPGWRFVGLPNKPDVSATRFELGQVEGVAGVQMRTNQSYGTWVHDWRGTAGTLQWRWRLDQALSGGQRPADDRRRPRPRSHFHPVGFRACGLGQEPAPRSCLSPNLA